jgi:hypothetical protein
MCLWQGSKKAVKPAHASHVAESEDSSEVGYLPIMNQFFYCNLISACSFILSTENKSACL